MTTETKRLIDIGRIAKAHGIKGELRVVLHNEESDLLGVGRVVFARSEGKVARTKADAGKASSGGSPKPSAPSADLRLRITRVRETTGALIVTFAEVPDRNAAEALHGRTLLVPRDEFPPLEDGEFYACDIEGAAVHGEGGEIVGTVSELVDYPTCSVLRVIRPDGSSVEYPLTAAVIASLDVEAHQVTVRGEGL